MPSASRCLPARYTREGKKVLVIFQRLSEYPMKNGDYPMKNGGSFHGFSIVMFEQTMEHHHFPWENHNFSWENHHFSWENHHFSWENHHFPWENHHFSSAPPGITSSLLARRNQGRVLAVDRSAQAVEKAQRRFPSLQLAVLDVASPRWKETWRYHERSIMIYIYI